VIPVFISRHFRDGPKDQNRNLEIPGSRFVRPGMTILSSSELFLKRLPARSSPAMTLIDRSALTDGLDAIVKALWPVSA
jgi:hypothetical protein